MLCRRCQIWELLASDQFCAWCGEKLIDFSVSIERDYLYVGDPISDLKLTIRHIGTIGEIELISASSGKSWLIVPAEQVEVLAGTLLHPGESIEIGLAVDVVDRAKDDVQAEITVDSSVGPRDLTVEVVPKPTIDKVSITGEHTILLDNVADERLTGYLAISKGVVTITNLRTDAEWAQVYATNCEIPCRLDARNKRLEFEFKLDEMRLLQEIESEGGTFPADRSANLLMKFAYLEPERNWPFDLKCLLPPELVIPEAESTIEVEAFVGKRAEFSLTLQNGLPGVPGHADLQIVSIEADIPCQPTMTIEYPLTVVSGQYQHLTFAVSLEDLEIGNHQGKLTLTTNTPGLKKQRDVFVEISIRQMPVFEGALAIDFGTTNSCCAFIDHRGREQLVPIDSDGIDNATASSAILYKNLLDDGNKDYEIGHYAYRFSLLGRSRCTVTQVKRWLGKEKDYEIRFRDDPEKTAKYRPREVTADILRRILQHAEDKVGARIISCTISHPCRFQFRQFEDLKFALAACGIAEGEINLVPEPVGAALDFIRGAEISTAYKTYHLMVFDFGGGTIDVTLMKVVNETRPGRNIVYVKPNVLGIGGDEHFGGEDVTESVLQIMHTNCEQEIQARNQTATNCIVPINEELFYDPRHKVLARLNRTQLRQRAESTKIAIATFGEDYLEQLDQILKVGKGSKRSKDDVVGASSLRTVLSDTFKLAAIVDGKVDETYSFTHQHIAPRKQQIDDELIPKLTEIIESMKALAKKKNVASPEIVLLSGKSSSFPIVRELVSKAFPQAAIEMPTDLKECVVRGACQLADEGPREGVAVKIEGGNSLNIMTSSLGISVQGSRGGHRFKSVIDNGEPIGREGIRKQIDLSGTDFTRRTRINIYENTGSNEYLVDSSGKDNPNIPLLKTFRLDSKLSQWERENNEEIDETDLDEALIELEVAANLRVKLVVTVPRIGQAFEFDANYLGG
jgi:molecular chaperone DnaK (HSP70)